MIKKRNNLIKTDLLEIQKPISKFLLNNYISVITGMAGSAKDFICMHTALKLLISKQKEKIIITKPIIEVGRSIGFMPGDKKDKIDPYRRSFDDIVSQIIGKEDTPTIKKLKSKIEFEPINFIRGNTFKDSVVILSEAQNCTLHEIISFMTRLDKSSLMFINGDLMQSDIGTKTGLKDILQIIEKVKGIEAMKLGDEFQMRNPIIVELNKEYRKFKSI